MDQPDTSAGSADSAELLRRDGYCLIPGALDSPLLERLRKAADALAESWCPPPGTNFEAQGSMIGVPQLSDPVFGQLIASDRGLAALAALGLHECSFTDGYVISKPGGSPRLFWHFDWYGWEDPTAYEAEPVQVALMYYLLDTNRRNGCLRVIPGSHIRRHPLHDLMLDGHSTLGSATPMNRPEFADWPDEIDIPVRAGDALVVDARLLHAAHANRERGRRSLITLWYQPRTAQRSPRVRATLAAKTQRLPAQWPDDARERVRRMQPPRIEGWQPLNRTMTGPRPPAIR